jgi:hypothetical protein
MTQPIDLMKHAEALAHSETPVERRAAVNRAYYAAFHALQEVLEPMCDPDDDFGLNGAMHHRIVVEKLRRWQAQYPNKRIAMQFGTEASNLFSKFVDLKEARERADYFLGASGDQSVKEAILAVSKAQRALQFAEKVSRAMASAA